MARRRRSAKGSRLSALSSALESLATRAAAETMAQSSCERATRILGKLDEQEQALVERGFPPMSPWWRETIGRWYRGGRRHLVARVGRRGGKSSSLSRVAVVEALHGGHVVPPGDVGTVAVVSIDRREAKKRITTICAILDALGEEYGPVDGGVQLARRPIAFQVFTASIAGVSGFTGIFVFCDEVAKWRDADTGANPATEVLASVRPTMATQPHARMVLSSSPLGAFDAHAKAFDEGETATQSVAHAPTWEANPTVSEAATHALEPDEQKWRREYAAVPMEGSEESMLSPSLLDHCTVARTEPLSPIPGWTYVAAIDPATRRNAWTLIVGTLDAQRRRIVVGAWQWEPKPGKPLDPDAVFAEMAPILAPYGVRVVSTDQWSGDALAAVARRHKLILNQETWNQGRKLDAWDDVATWMRDGAVELPAHPMLRADLLGVRRKVTPAGLSLVYALTPDGRHSDFAPPIAAVLTALATVPRAVPQGPGEQMEADALKRDLKRFAPKKPVRWWERDPLGRR